MTRRQVKRQVEQNADRRLTGDGASRRLWAFAVVSLCLHAGLLLAAKSGTPDFRGHPAASRSIELILVDRPTHIPEEMSVPERRQRRAPIAAARPAVQRAQPERRAVRQQVQNTAKPIASAMETVPEPEHTAPAARAAELSGPIDEDTRNAKQATPRRHSTRAQVEALLLTDLARHFEYPALARRRGWQGMVLLSVAVKSDGELERVHVSESSGYDILDRSAVATVRRIGHIARGESWLNGQGMELLLPVVYRLTD